MSDHCFLRASDVCGPGTTYDGYERKCIAATRTDSSVTDVFSAQMQPMLQDAASLTVEPTVDHKAFGSLDYRSVPKIDSDDFATENADYLCKRHRSTCGETRSVRAANADVFVDTCTAATMVLDVHGKKKTYMFENKDQLKQDYQNAKDKFPILQCGTTQWTALDERCIKVPDACYE